MSEIEKTVGQWIVSHLGLSIIILLFLLSCFFKVVKKEIDPLGWFVGWIGKHLTKRVREDVADLKKSTEQRFAEVKKDRIAKVDELKEDYNEKIKDLREDLDSFEKTTNGSIYEIKTGTTNNCQQLKTRLDEMEAAHQKSNDMQTVMQIRSHILDFANSCMNDRQHSKKEFENIIDENTLYEELVKKYNIKNAVYTEDYKYVMEIYHQCQKKGSFLNPEKVSSDK